MHDPLTVAFEIRSPFGRAPLMKNGNRSATEPRYHRPLVTIWHRDPEHGGDDDSCGWFGPRQTDADRNWSVGYAKREWPFWFSKEYGIINLRTSDDIAVLSQAWREAREHARPGSRWDALKAWELSAILMVLSSPGDNFGHLIRRARESTDGLQELLGLTLRYYRRTCRPWYRHPKWHINHWSIQVHDLQTFNRWAFSRCATCGKRFPWGYSPVSHGWGGNGGPKFLRGEKGVHHHECAGMGIGSAESLGSVARG